MAAKKDIIIPPKRETDASVWLIWGTDDYFVSRHAREVVNRLCPPAEQALGLEIVEGRAESADDAVRALRNARSGLQTLGLFGGAKVVWLRDANFFSENNVGKLVVVKDEVTHLTSMIKSGLDPGQRLVISASKVDRRSAFYKACQTLAEVREFSIPEKTWEQEKYAVEIIETLLDEAGLEATPAAVAGLYGKVGCNSRQLAMEIEKLRAFVGEQTRIGEEEVRRIASSSRESAGWDLMDAMGERNLNRSLEILRQLLFQGEKEFLLIMGLQSRVRELIVFRTCLDQGWLEVSGSDRWTKAVWRGAGEAEAVIADLPENLQPARLHPFRAARLAAQAQRYTKSELLRAQQILLHTHEAMIRTATPPDLLLELGLVKIMGKTHAA